MKCTSLHLVSFYCQGRGTNNLANLSSVWLKSLVCISTWRGTHALPYPAKNFKSLTMAGKHTEASYGHQLVGGWSDYSSE